MKQIVEHIRGYASHRSRKLAISMLRKLGFSHFVCFKDVQSDYALQYGTAAWAQPGSIYVDW